MDFLDQLGAAFGANMQAAQAERATRTAMNTLVTQERRIKELFDILDDIDQAAHNQDIIPEAAPLKHLLDSMKRALLTPGGNEAQALLRAIARFESVRQPVPADPEADK